MTVSSSTNVVILSADGSTHSFSFTFKIFAASDLKVIVRSAAGVETEKTLDSHYIIPTSSVGNTSGGNILFANDLYTMLYHQSPPIRSSISPQNVFSRT